MTKSDFVDQVADSSGLSKKDAGVGRRRGHQVDRGCPAARRRGLVHGLRQVPRRPARRARGPQPAHRRDDADRREQGPALHGRIGPQEGDQVAATGDALSVAGEASPADAVRRPPRARRSPRASPRSSSGSTPTRPSCGRTRVDGSPSRAPGSSMALADVERSAGARPRRRRPRRAARGRRGRARPLPRADRRGRTGLRRGQAAARLLRAARLPRLARARGDGRARARRRACS